MRTTDDETLSMAERLAACDRVVDHFAAIGNVAAQAFALDRRAGLIWMSTEPLTGRDTDDDLRRAVELASTTDDRRLEAICRADLATYLLSARGAADTSAIAEAINQFRNAIPAFEQLGELDAALSAKTNLELALARLAGLVTPAAM